MVAKRSSKSALPAEWNIIPGYDPEATAGDCWFDVETARSAVEFFPVALKHVKGEKAGQPFILEPWQQAAIANMFGWKRPDGTRRYRRVLIYVPRKNGKTALVAGICLYVLMCDGEAGAEIYSAAAEREQAALIFDHASGMVRQNPEMGRYLEVLKRAIILPTMNSSYKVLSADANTKHGFNTHLAMIDELHAQNNRDLVDVLETSTSARRQPLIVHITTSDYDRPSICNEVYDYACRVRDQASGFNDPSFLPVLYGASIDDDWKAEATWWKANPNLGVSKSLEYMREQCTRAQETPTYENTFKRLELNIRTQTIIKWLSLESWDHCRVSMPDLTGRECYAGLDLASTTDMTAMVLVFPPESRDDDDPTFVLPFFWSPAETARLRERRDRVPYQTWGADGHLYLTEGNRTDYRVIRAKINELQKKYDIKQIAVDQWNSQQLQHELIDDGFDVMPFSQSIHAMSDPSKQLERMVANGTIKHDGNPVLRWMAGNVMVRANTEAKIKPDKQKSADKIDGIIALVMALGSAALTGDNYEPIVFL